MSMLGWLITWSVQCMNADSLSFLILEFSSLLIMLALSHWNLCFCSHECSAILDLSISSFVVLHHNFFSFISSLIIGSHIGLMSMLGWLITWPVQCMNADSLSFLILEFYFLLCLLCPTGICVFVPMSVSLFGFICFPICCVPPVFIYSCLWGSACLSYVSFKHNVGLHKTKKEQNMIVNVQNNILQL